MSETIQQKRPTLSYEIFPHKVIQLCAKYIAYPYKSSFTSYLFI